MTPAQITSLRATLGQSLGYGSGFDGSPLAYSQLSADQQLALVNRLKAYILAAPDQFNATQLALAGRPPLELTTDYTVGEQVADFFGEMGNQAVDLNANINPFSERNRGWVLGAAVAGLAVYFLAPLALAALRKTT